MGKVVSFLLQIFFVIDLVLICVLNLCGVNWAQIPYPVQSVFFGDSLKYSVRGVDVSEYQGNIDWDVLAKQNINFAYIKATKGSDYKDNKFVANWENARKTNVKVGAYHLFHYDQPALEQAENFISSVPIEDGILPPAVDVELYGKDRDDPPEREKTILMLTEFLEKLEKHYGKKPVIYATKKAYKLYIAGNFKEYPLWIRNPDTEPVLPDGRTWTFWQYNNDGELDGYKGESRFIDLNVFNGTEKDFDNFIN
jgi:lysozyme